MYRKIIAMCLILFMTVTALNTYASAATSSEIMEGAWLGEWPNQSKYNIEAFNNLTNTQSKIIHTFVNTNQNFSVISKLMNYVHNQGAINMITIEPNGWTTVDINNGMLDSYFTEMASNMKSWQNGSEIWIRFMDEMNGNWYSWGIGDSNINTNQTYINAYRRVVNIFRNAGAMNVKWIYCVNAENVGINASYTMAYPGNEYVDYVAIDGYNYGTSQSWSTWKWFRQVFDKAYYTINRYNKPLIISEWGSSEQGGDKSVWIKEAYKQIKSGVYANLKAVVWFNENKETNWLIESSAKSSEAYKNRWN